MKHIFVIDDDANIRQLILRYLEKVDKGSDDRGQAKTLGENDNVVRLMSIHKSKGLEEDNVILIIDFVG